MSALTCTSVTAGYTKQRPCVRDVNLTVEPGQITCLLGPNGAGKTTLLLSLAGLLPRFDGAVEVNGRSVAAGNPRDAVRAGMTLVPDDRSLFRRLSTEHNLRLAIRNRRSRASGIQEIVEYFPSLGKRLHIAAGRLSGGEQQMLAIGRAILQRPSVLAIDELSMGLAPVVVDEILSVLRRLTSETSMAVVLVEQHVHLALGIADRAAVLVHGSIALEAPAADLRADPSLVERAYMGGA